MICPTLPHEEKEPTLSVTGPTQRTEAKPKRKWPWVVAAVFCGSFLYGQLFPGGPSVHGMSCIELNDEMDTIRADHIQEGVIQPFTAWGQEDLDRMRALIEEVTDRQSDPGNYCALRGS